MIFVCLVIISYLQPVFADYGTFNFKKIVTDIDGKKYVIGEIQNTYNGSSIESEIYFSNSDTNSSYYEYNVGIIGNDMAMPFKIPDLNFNGKDLNLDDMKVESHSSLRQPSNFLQVDYSSLHMDQKTHAISGVLQNKSPIDAFGVKVIAIAMGSHAEVLDVVGSNNTITKISSNSSATFTLIPMDSIANKVSYYSCFAPGSLGQNYTLQAEDGKEIKFQLDSDGEIKNVNYDPSTHSINLDIDGVFPMGGWAEVMVFSAPDSFSKSNGLDAIMNGQNATKSISSVMIINGSQYKHLSFLFPFGKNSVSIVPSSRVVPEFSIPVIISTISFLSMLLFFRKFVTFWSKLESNY